MKSNQILCVSYSYEWGMQWHIYFPCPMGPWGEVKGQISLNINYKVNFKDFFLYQTLCVFSQIKDVEQNTSRIFTQGSNW